MSYASNRGLGLGGKAGGSYVANSSTMTPRSATIAGKRSSAIEHREFGKEFPRAYGAALKSRLGFTANSRATAIRHLKERAEELKMTEVWLPKPTRSAAAANRARVAKDVLIGGTAIAALAGGFIVYHGAVGDRSSTASSGTTFGAGTTIGELPNPSPTAGGGIELPSQQLTSGSIVCTGTVRVTLTTGDRHSPLRAMQRVTGESFTAIAPKAAAEQLWTDVQQTLNGGPVNLSAVGTSFIAPTNCTF